MTDPSINPFGRQLLSLAIGRVAYLANVQKKNVEMIRSANQRIEQTKENFEMFHEMSVDITMTMLDKRYKESQAFIQSGGEIPSTRFKRSISEDQKRLASVLERNALRSKMKYQNETSKYNQLIADKKMASALRQYKGE